MATRVAKNLLMLSDNLVEVQGVQDATDESFINTATIELTLKDSSGTNVTGQSWPLTLSYVSGSNGNYQGTLEEELVLNRNQVYTAEIQINAGGDKLRNFQVKLRAREDIL